MVDPQFAAAIARQSAPDEKTLLIEVGPGTGCLTLALLNAHPAARILAIEIDRGLAAALREALRSLPAGERVTLLEGDALSGKHALSPELVKAAQEISISEHRPRRVLCANLPYNAATPLLANLAADREGLSLAEAVVTVQLEAAQRLFAQAGTRAYGPLAVLMALRADGEIARKAGNEIFWPRPQVDSAVIGLRFRPWPEANQPGLQRAEAGPFQVFLRTLFSKRRKTLRGALKPLRIPAAVDVTPDERAENLSPGSLLALFRGLNTAGC